MVSVQSVPEIRKQDAFFSFVPSKSFLSCSSKKFGIFLACRTNASGGFLCVLVKKYND